MTENNGLPPDWDWVPLGEIVEDVVKVQPKENPDSEFVYLDISSIDNSKFKIVSPKHYLGKEAPSRARQLVKAGDILFSTVRTYLKNIAQVPPIYDNQIASTGFCIIRPKSPHNKDFYFYLALSDQFISLLSKIQRGTSYPAVRNSDVFEQYVPVPTAPEQERIVAKIEELFTQLEAGVAELEQAKAQLQRYRQAVLKSAIEGELTREWRELHQSELEPAEKLLAQILSERRAKWEAEQWEKEIVRAQKKAAQAKRKAAGRPSRISDLKPEEWENLSEEEYGRFLPKNDKWKEKYKEPVLPDMDGLAELPDGWVWVSAEQISDFITKGTTPKANKLFSNEGEIPFLKVYNLTFDGSLDFSYQPTFVSKETHQGELARSLVLPGDVLMNIF